MHMGEPWLCVKDKKKLEEKEKEDFSPTCKFWTYGQTYSRTWVIFKAGWQFDPQLKIRSNQEPFDYYFKNFLFFRILCYGVSMRVFSVTWLSARVEYFEKEFLSKPDWSFTEKHQKVCISSNSEIVLFFVCSAALWLLTKHNNFTWVLARVG